MMAAEGNNNMIRGIYTGDELPERRVIHTAWGEEIMLIILPYVTHLTIAESITFIPGERFCGHPDIVKLICHENVVRLRERAFYFCPRLERVVMRGVEEIEEDAFNWCESLEDVECDELERIGYDAFGSCESLGCIDLPSARIVENGAFSGCEAMKYVTFGPSLESIRSGVFADCHSLERITIPLKNDLFSDDDTFRKCRNLRHVHIVEKEVLNDTVNALLLKVWRDDMNEVIYSIEDILPDAPAGGRFYCDDGEKAIVIREWISSVLSKVIHYKAQHRQILNEAACTLEHLLPKDMVMNNVISFIELPSHTFDGEDDDGQNDATEKITTP